MNRRIQHRLNTAKEFETEGKFLHAAQIYHSLISDYPEYIEAYINLADIYQANGYVESAEKILKSILAKQPHNNEIKLYLSQFYMQNKDWAKALELLSGLSSKDSFVKSPHTFSLRVTMPRMPDHHYLTTRMKAPMGIQASSHQS